MTEVIKSGYLIKEGANWKTLNRRFLVLRQKLVTYSELPDSLILKGTFYIDHKTVIQDSDRPRDHCFEVVTPSRIYYFSVEDEDSKSEWKDAFNLAIFFNKIDWDPIAVASELSTEVKSVSKHVEDDHIVKNFLEENLLTPINEEKMFELEGKQIPEIEVWRMSLEKLLESVEKYSSNRDFVLQCLHVASQALLDLNPIASPLKEPIFHNFLPALVLLRAYENDKQIVIKAVTTACFLFALWGPLAEKREKKLNELVSKLAYLLVNEIRTFLEKFKTDDEVVSTLVSCLAGLSMCEGIFDVIRKAVRRQDTMRMLQGLYSSAENRDQLYKSHFESLFESLKGKYDGLSDIKL